MYINLELEYTEITYFGSLAEETGAVGRMQLAAAS
jgi:hypothetical protein